VHGNRTKKHTFGPRLGCVRDVVNCCDVGVSTVSTMFQYVSIYIAMSGAVMEWLAM